MLYRPEIDGLRAVAVLPVILYHANISWLSGGYVGVDIFFVISGYLITTIIATELAQGRFSLADFYIRRARRILPALFALLLLCIPVASLLMLPAQLADFGKNVVAVLLFVSNIQLWIEGGYFETDSSMKPLLHTWSLAVEEQFYLVFPLLMIFAWRLGMPRLFWLVTALAAVSLALAEGQRWLGPPVSYYLTPARVWELLAGSICALLLLGRMPRGNGALALLGLAMIGVAVAKFHQWTPMPSIYALLPVGGAVLIVLFATRETLVGRLLALRPLVGIGLISYSAYLWHQPLFAFARLQSFEEPGQPVFLALSLAALLLGWLSWRFVELPFRRKGGISFRHPKAMLAGAVACSLGLAGAGVLLTGSGGLPQRLPGEVQRQFAEGGWSHRCLFQVTDGPVSFPTEGCVFGKGSTKVAILGDSIAASLAPAIIESLGGQDVEIHQLTHGMCLPAIRTIPDTHVAAACADYMQRATQHLREIGVDLVVTAASWPDFGRETHYDGAPIPELTEVQRDAIAADIATTLASLRAPVLMLMPHPHAGKRILEASGRYYNQTRQPIRDYSVSHADFAEANAVAFDVLRRVRLTGLTQAEAHRAMCRDGRCYFVEGGRLILSDFQHFTHHGAHRVVALAEVQRWFAASLAGEGRS